MVMPNFGAIHVFAHFLSSANQAGPRPAPDGHLLDSLPLRLCARH